MNEPKNINILIPDGERVLAQFTANCLADCKNVRTHVISTDPNASIKFSRHIACYTFAQKPQNNEDWIEFVLGYVKKNSIDVLMPVEIENIQIFTSLKKESYPSLKLLVPPLNSFKKTLDKWLFHVFLETNEIKGPVTYKDLKELEQNKEKINFPMLMKPIVGMGGFGIKLVDDFDSIEKIFLQNKNYMVQEFINGYDIDMSVLCKNGKILAYTIQKGYIFSTSKYSAPLGVKFLFDQSLFDVVDQVMKKLNWSGFAHVDLKYEQETGSYKILEINPRAWGSIEASKSVGINFPYLYILSALGLEYKMPAYRFDTCANSVGLIKALKSNLLKGQKRISIPNHNYALKRILDPLPLINDFMKGKKN